MDAVTRNYRAQNLALQAQTIRDLQRLWPALDWRNLERTYPTWFAGAALVIQRDRTRAAGLASLYLKAHRLQAGVPGESTVKLAGPAPAEQVATSMRVTTLVAIKKSTMAGKTADMAMRDAFVQAVGAATKLVLNGGRETVRATTIADRRTAGWVRVGNGGCDWCAQYLDGEVHMTEGYDFEAHDHCTCTAQPAYL